MRLAYWRARPRDRELILRTASAKTDLKESSLRRDTESPSRTGVARKTRALPYTRERRRLALREYLTGLRFGSILVMPAPLFTSMI